MTRQTKLIEALTKEMEHQKKILVAFKMRLEAHPRDALAGCTNVFYAAAVVEVYGELLAQVTSPDQHFLGSLIGQLDELSRMPISTSSTAPDLLMQVGMKQARQDLLVLVRGVI